MGKRHSNSCSNFAASQNTLVDLPDPNNEISSLLVPRDYSHDCRRYIEQQTHRSDQSTQDTHRGSQRHRRRGEQIQGRGRHGGTDIGVHGAGNGSVGKVGALGTMRGEKTDVEALEVAGLVALLVALVAAMGLGVWWAARKVRGLRRMQRMDRRSRWARNVEGERRKWGMGMGMAEENQVLVEVVKVDADAGDDLGFDLM